MSEFKFCRNCGAPLEEGAKFCGNCGMPIQEDEPDAEGFYTQTDDESEEETDVEPETETENEQQEDTSDLDDESLYEDSETEYEDEETGQEENPDSRKLRPFIIAGIIALVVIIGIVVFVVWRNSRTSDTEQDMVEEVPEEDESDELAEAVSQMSDEEIQQSAKDLYNQLVTDASDPDAFAVLYKDTTEEDIQVEQEYFSGLDLGEDEKQIVTVVIKEAPSVAVQIETYETGDEFSDTSDTFIMTYTEDGWKKDLSDDVADEVYSPENIEEIYPEAYLQALNADRNAYEFDACFLYLDDTEVFEGDFIANLAFLSQDEYDCLTAYVWMGNGTEEEVSIQEISLTVTDDSLGDVLNQAVSREETISVGEGRLIQLHFDDASDVLTGTQEWTKMNASVSAGNKGETEVQAGSVSSSGGTGSAEIQGYPDLYAEYDYDIDAYRKDLESEYSNLSLSTSILFEDGGLVCIGLKYYQDGDERRAAVAVPKTTAGTSKTIDDYICSKCSGNGVISKTGTDRETCPICNGTGQMYVANAVYDVTLNAWVGQYMACSGCGGAGYIDYTTEYYDWCDKCNGYGVTK